MKSLVLQLQKVSSPAAHCPGMMSQHLQSHFALSRGRTCLSRSLTRGFLLIKPKGNKKHFIDKTKKLGRNEG